MYRKPKTILIVLLNIVICLGLSSFTKAININLFSTEIEQENQCTVEMTNNKIIKMTKLDPEFQAKTVSSDWTFNYVDSIVNISINNIALGDGNNDGETEIYASIGSDIFQYKWEGGIWTKTVLGSGGDWSTHIAVSDGDNDSMNEVYVTGGNDQKLYQFEWNGSSWTKTEIGSTSGSNRQMITVIVGDGDNDGFNEVYAGEGTYANGYLFQFKWDGTNWIETTIDYAGSMNFLQIHDGNNDGDNELYVNTDGHINFGPEWDTVHEYKWNGFSWSDYEIFTNPWRAAYGLGVGDGTNNGSAEVYFTDVEGDLMQAIWDGMSWNYGVIANSGWGTINDLAIGDGDNDGNLEIYGTGSYIAQFKYDGSIWNRTYLNENSSAFRRVKVGDGNNDDHIEVYVIEEEWTDFENVIYHLIQISTKITPAWTPAYNTLFDSPSDLKHLRQYRDKILSKTTKGKMYKSLLYKNSGKALELLLSNPELMLQAKYLININKDAVSEVIGGSKGVIYNTNEIISFLDAYAEKSPPDLKVLAYMVKREMLTKQRQDKLFLGFKLK